VNKTRCSWVGTDTVYIKYHDEEWGVPVHNDKIQFEFLVLEGAQAGLSWITILKRREGYKRVFYNFDAKKVATMSEADLQRALLDPGIIRNKLKIRAAVKNAQVFLDIQEEFGSFSDYIWGYVGNKTLVNSCNFG
jgi:DNA-3-methyladenine glycosylase I